MLKKMRWRFIAAAMLSITAVMASLVLVINLWNYSITLDRINTAMDGLMEQREKRPFPQKREELPPHDFLGKPSEEAPYMMRFFSVIFNADGKTMFIGTDFITSVSREEAASYASSVLKTNRNSGFFGEYRYAVRKTDTETFVFFLNVSNEQQFMLTLLIISCLVACISILVVFILVLLFSKQAILPYAQNIERQKKFITDAGHEIKTPLTSIAMSAEVLSMENTGNEWVENIQKQTRRLSELTEKLIVLSRLDEAEPFPEQRNFSLSDAVWETAEPFLGLADAKKKTFSCHIEENLNMYGDKAYIQQMISILLDNALRYSSENGRIRLDVGQSRRNLVIEVFNTCCTADIPDINRLFDRFYRPDASRSSSTGGFGVGLSIAKAVAEAHNGTISVRCVEDTGIVFQICFSAL